MRFRAQYEQYFPSFSNFADLFNESFRRVKQEQRMKNKENIYFIVLGKRGITSLSLTY